MPDTVSTISPATAETFRSQAKARGLSDSMINATLAKAGVGQSATAEPDKPTVTVNSAHVPNLTAAQNEALASQLEKFFTGDRALLEKAFEKAGLTEISDERSPRELEFDNSLGGVSESEYSLDGLWLNRTSGLDPATGLNPATMAAETASLRTALAAIEYPPAAALGFCAGLIDSASRFAAIRDNPTAVSLYHQSERLTVERLGKSLGGFDAVMKLAGQAFARVPEAIRENLIASGAMSSASSIINLAHQQARLNKRTELAERRIQGK